MTLHVCLFPTFKTSSNYINIMDKQTNYNSYKDCHRMARNYYKSKKKKSEKKTMIAHNEDTILIFTNETFITFKLSKTALTLRKSSILNGERLYGLFCAN